MLCQLQAEAGSPVGQSSARHTMPHTHAHMPNSCLFFPPRICHFRTVSNNHTPHTPAITQQGTGPATTLALCAVVVRAALA